MTQENIVNVKAKAVDGMEPETKETENKAEMPAEKKQNFVKRGLDYVWDHKGTIAKGMLGILIAVGAFAAGKKIGESHSDEDDETDDRLALDSDDNGYSEDDYDETEDDEDVAEDYTEEAV